MAQHSKRPRAIVVVEGDRRNGEFLRTALSNGDFDVVGVSTVEAALREIRMTTNVVAVVDDDLPLVRGLDLVGRLRGERRDLESILITRDESVVSLTARLHVERFRALRKPLHLEDLRACVTESIQRLGLRERQASNAPPEGASESDEHAALRRRVEALERASHAPPSGDANPEETPVEAAAKGAAEDDALRVLVVDDDPLVRKAVARTLKRHHVVVAENGRAATREIERAKPDVIISDLMMPEMDGIELAEEIKERWPDLSTRIVFVSGVPSQMERVRKVAPQQPLLTKPVSSGQLEARIVEVLEAAIRRR
jgi:two-component system cell cycle response regulator CpdR